MGLFNRLMFVRAALAAFLLAMVPMGLLSQKIRFYNSEQGLPSSLILKVAQDERGYIWLATENGAGYFDGMRFTTFRHDRSRQGTISSDLVKVIYTDSRHNCWVGTANGLLLFDYETGVFHNVNLKHGQVADSYYISSIVETPDKEKLLVSVAGFGIIVVDANSRAIDHEATDKLMAIYNETYAGNLLFDSEGNLWSFAEQGNFFRFDYKNQKLRKNLWGGDFSGVEGKMVVSALAEDPQTGNMLVGTFKHGLWVYDKTLGFVRKAKGSNASSPKYSIRALVAENPQLSNGASGIWVGTEGAGLKKFDRRTEEIVNVDLQNAPINLGLGKVHSLMQDTQGNIWAAFFQKGLVVIPKSSNGFETLRLSTSDSDCKKIEACVTSVVRDLDGNLWVGTDGGGLLKVEKSGLTTQFTSENTPLPNNAVMSLAVDKRGTLWVSTYMGGVVSYNSNTGFRLFSNEHELQKVDYLLYHPNTDRLFFATLGHGVKVWSFGDNSLSSFPLVKSLGWVYTLYADNSDVLWVGRSNGVRCFDIRTGEERNTDLVEKIGDSRIYSILEHDNGAIWLGSVNGLMRFDVATRELRTFTKKEGLPSNQIAAIQKDESGMLWLATTNGLARFNPNSNVIGKYYAYDGLQDNEFRNGASFKDADGKMFFGGINGVSAFYPRNVGKWKHKIPNIYFSRLTVLSRHINYDAALGKGNVLDSHISRAKQITLANNQNVFSIEFAVLEYSNPQKVVYGYMMKGFDTDWRYTEPTHRSATYTNLPDGKYTFMVKAFFEGNADEQDIVFNQIDILILPPWYKTWWAYLLYLAFASAIVWALVYFLNRRRELIEERMEYERKEMRLKMFTNLSHEIRTPLNLVMNPLKSMRETEPDPKRKDVFNLMYRNALRILHLVNQLMDMRKIDNHQLKIHFANADMIGFINDVMKSFEHLALVRNIDFRLLSSRDSLNVWFDQAHFDKVLYNILSNSFKFTPDHGYVHISIDILPNHKAMGLSPELAECVEIRFENSGSSMPASELESVFEQYLQGVDNDNSGSEIGLHLAKMIVGLHHGAISSQSVEGGMGFVVRIPLGNSHLSVDELNEVSRQNEIQHFVRDDEKPLKESDYIEMPELDEEIEDVKVSKSKRTVVVVDDDFDFCRYIRLELSDSYNVELCTDGAEAWKVISTTIPDAVVTDLGMPKLDGMALCRKIRQNLETNYLPVVILTAETAEESKRLCIEYGADSYLTKPVGVELLKSTIAQVIQTRDLIRNKYRSNINPDFGEMQISSPDSRLVAKVIETIRKNIENPDFNVDDLSREVGLSRVHLNRKLKENINTSPNNLIKSIRLKQAAYLLIKNKVNVSDVAYKVGFSSHSYFSNNFREYFGMRPTEFVEKYWDSDDKEALNKLFEG